MKQSTRRKGRRRGQTLVIALGLILMMSMLVAATQLQVVVQLSQSRNQRDFERALQMAEAGANAYLNRVSSGTATGAGSGYLPPVTPVNAPNSVITLSAFKAGVLNGTYPIIRYPSGTQQGYYVYALIPGAGMLDILSYGWSNGIVRRVRVAAQSASIFDWASIYGLNPYSTSGNGVTDGPAWKFTGSANVVGASGAEGLIDGSNNVTYYDGPLILAAAGSTLNSGYNPTIFQSLPNVPTGHSGTGILANPPIRRLVRSLDIGTADQAANEWAANLGVSTTAGVEYFKTNNNNATGLRYLVKNDTTNLIRELNDPLLPYTVVPTTGNNAYTLSWPNNSALNAAGKVTGETFIGIRAYPGNYYFQQITQQTQDKLYLRTFADGEAGTSPDNIPVYNYLGTLLNPNNPNSGMSSERNVRFWVGNPTSGNPPNSSFSDNTFMEHSSFSSRFRVYVASRGKMTVSGTNANPPQKFRVNMLVYNSYVPTTGPNAGQTIRYGNISIASGTYLFGSLIGWKVTVAGGCTIEKQAAEGGSTSDQLTYTVTDWTELP